MQLFIFQAVFHFCMHISTDGYRREYVSRRHNIIAMLRLVLVTALSDRSRKPLARMIMYRVPDHNTIPDDVEI